ncbi:hypothetical protein LO762_06245 [Actinocorallia sp. API 0066]|nr:hypothetical protein [Actinocorallia sp. API 0066]
MGNIAALGAWNPAHAIPLSAASYPVWSRLTIVPKSTSIEYKYIRKDANGNVTWEGGGNRSFSTGSGSSHTVSNTWQ